jgi:hypothetical protein
MSNKALARLAPSSYKILSKPRNSCAKLADGSKLYYEKCVSLSIATCGFSEFRKVYISDKLNYDIILGTDFLVENNLAINPLGAEFFFGQIKFF